MPGVSCYLEMMVISYDHGRMLLNAQLALLFLCMSMAETLVFSYIDDYRRRSRELKS